MKFRKPLTITSRTSSITNSFVQAIIPNIVPSERERFEAFQVLGINPDAISCVYCGAGATDWDHLRPLVRNKRPTGYINEIRNRVPSCAPCNQSKGGADWRRWMQSNAIGSPKTRGVRDIKRRMKRLELFEKWGRVEPLPLREFVGDENWNAYWADLDVIVKKMFDAQAHAGRVRSLVMAALQARQSVKETLKMP
jgi:hypothetical protein